MKLNFKSLYVAFLFGPIAIKEVYSGGYRNLIPRLKARLAEYKQNNLQESLLVDRHVPLKSNWLTHFTKPHNKKKAVTCIGYFLWQIGISEATKLLFNAINDAGIECNIFPINAPDHKRAAEVDILRYKKHLTSEKFYRNHLYFVNGDSIVDVIPVVQRRAKKKPLKTFAVFWWEFDNHFYFKEALESVDHVIVYTDFVKMAIERAAKGSVKVTKLLYPLQSWEMTYDGVFAVNYRAKNNLNGDDYLFFFNFDFASGFERKNPLALLKAFSIVNDRCPNTKLLLKISSANKLPAEYAQVKDYIKELALTKKVIIDLDNYSKNEMLNIINLADCYVSLHRSEGLGLGMLEAMQLGKPVISTNYGGNTEFMTQEVACLLDYVECEVQEDYGPYKKGYIWADPNIKQAEEYMLNFAENPEQGVKMGLLAKKHVEEKYSSENVRKNLQEFLAKELI